MTVGTKAGYYSARIAHIKDRVIDCFDSGDWNLLATYLGDRGNVITGHSRLLRSLYFGDEDYAACVGDVLGKLIGQDDEVLLLIEQMLDEKRTDDDQSGGGGIAAPFFETNDNKSQEIDVNLISAMMPFRPEFADVRDAIDRACKTVGRTLKAADDIWENSILIQDILELIERSCIIVVDFTGKNPNVMYETGIAHALRKEVIPITQSIDDVPFDLKHHRVLCYENNATGRIQLQHSLESRMKTIIERHHWMLLPPEWF